jgi:aconitate hydratase
VVIAAITSCTNTSNPSVMLGAGLLARRPSSEGPEGQAVGQDLARAGLEGGHRLPRQGRPLDDLDALGFNTRRLRLHHLHRQLGPAAGAEISKGIARTATRRRLGALGQPQLRRPRAPEVKMNYLASPPLVVAYALAGTHRHRPDTEPLGRAATASRCT